MHVGMYACFRKFVLIGVYVCMYVYLFIRVCVYVYMDAYKGSACAHMLM